MQNTYYPVGHFLANYINEITVVTNHCLDIEEQAFDYFADGFPGIIYFQGEENLYAEAQQQFLEPLFIYGQTIKPITLSTKGNFRMIVFTLTPTAVYILFGINARELTDTCLDISLLHSQYKSVLLEPLQNSGSTETQIELISIFLKELILRKNLSLKNPLQYAIQKLQQSKGTAPLQQLQEELNFCPRTFQRKFEQHVGISPGMFARVCRFQNSLALVRQNNFDKLSDIAYETGYADQSHFIRTFKEFTGFTPLDFKKGSKIKAV